MASILYSLRQHDSILLSGLSKHLAHSHHLWQCHHFLKLKSWSGWQLECSVAHQPFFYSSPKAAPVLICSKIDFVQRWYTVEKHHINRFAESHIPLIFKFLFCPCHGQDAVFRFTLPGLIIEALQGKMFSLSLQK